MGMQPPFGFQLVFNTKAMSATMQGNIGVGAGPVGPVLTGPLFRKKLVGVTINNQAMGIKLHS